MKYTSLKQIKDLYTSIYYMEEDMILDVILSVTIATKLKGDGIWLLIIGGPSSGKSELCNILNEVEFVFPVSSLTENTFLSNMRLSDGKEASLLHRIGPNGMITMKDYTSILSMRPEKRELIVSQMREIYDGKLVKESGNGNPQKWEGKINWIGAVTDSIYIKEGESGGMGRRTINYVMPRVDRKKITRRSIENIEDIDVKRKQIQIAVKEFVQYKIKELAGQGLPKLPQDVVDSLVDLADFVTLARTETERNYRGQLVLVPEPEMPMRVFSMFMKIVQVMVHISDEKEMTEDHKKIIFKIAMDSIQKQRMIPLKLLAQYKSVTRKGAAMEANYPTETMSEWLENLNVLGVVERTSIGSGSDQWSIKEEYREILRKYGGIEMKSGEALVGDDEEVSSSNDINPTWVAQSYKKSDDPGEVKAQKQDVDKAFDMLF